MFSVTTEWNENQKKLQGLFAHRETMPAGLALCKTMHASLHQFAPESILSRLVQGMPEDCFRYRIPGKFETIVWDLWHITRIEDAVANLLIAGTSQVFNTDWMEKLGTDASETGNSMTGEIVAELTGQINIPALLEYRHAVGINTQAILGQLNVSALRDKPSPESLAALAAEKVITSQPESEFLRDFWGRKTVIGLLQMPITRHQIVHINDCFKVKAKYQRLNRPGLSE